MNSYLFDSYKKEYDADSALIKRYNNFLPEELLKLWTEKGFGTFMGGYLKTINPEEYIELVKETYFRGELSIPIFVTAFGDVIVWEENQYVRMIMYKEGKFKGMEAGFKFFFDDLMNDAFRRDFFEIDLYNSAKVKLGELTYKQCYGFVPLLGLGGKKSVDNLDIVSIKEHIEIITQIVGRVGF